MTEYDWLLIFFGAGLVVFLTFRDWPVHYSLWYWSG